MNILYTTDTCSKCPAVKEWLTNNNIPYEVCTDMALMRSKNIISVPVLELEDGSKKNLVEIINYIRESGGKL